MFYCSEIINLQLTVSGSWSGLSTFVSRGRRLSFRPVSRWFTSNWYQPCSNDDLPSSLGIPMTKTLFLNPWLHAVQLTRRFLTPQFLNLIFSGAPSGEPVLLHLGPSNWYRPFFLEAISLCRPWRLKGNVASSLNRPWRLTKSYQPSQAMTAKFLSYKPLPAMTA